MFFWMARSAARAANKSMTGKGVPRNQVKSTPCHPFAVFLIITVLVISIGWMGLTHHLNNGMLTFDIVASSSLAITGLLTAGPRDGTRKLTDLPNPENILPKQATSSELHTRAQALSGDPEQPATATLALPVGWATIAQLRGAADDDEHMMRVASVLIMPCRLCRVKGGQSCRPVRPDDPDLYVLDRTRNLYAHGTRIGFAIRKGTAKITEIVAQFGDAKVPDSVWKAAL